MVDRSTRKCQQNLVWACSRLCSAFGGRFWIPFFLHDKHGYFMFETAIGFHAAYGFGAFVFVVLLGKELRKLIMRPEDYYAPVVETIEHEDEHHHDDHEGDHHA